MYPDVGRTVRLAQRTDEDRPVILCEYSHSMNNSNGNLHLYWKEFWNPETPRLQGGYIWDMIDQGLRKKNAKGREFFAYGGDFGDVVNDRQFCINGMFSPERIPHPSVAEIKYLMQPVDICVTEPDTGRLHLKVSGDKVDPVSFRIENRYTFRDLSHLSWNWQLVCDRSKAPLLEGTGKSEKELLSSLDLSAAVKTLWEMEELKSSNFGCSYFLNIQGVLKVKQPWAGNGHELVSKQFPVDFTFDGIPKPPSGPSSPIDLGPLSIWISTDANVIQVSRGDAAPFVGIDKTTGGINSIQWTDTNIFHGRGTQPNFTRATTDNDRGGMELVLAFMKLDWAKPLFLLFEGMDNFSHNLRWEMRGLSHDAPPKLVCNDVAVTKEDPDLVTIEAKCSIVSVRKRNLFEKTITYEIHRSGKIHVSYRIVPSDFLRSIPSLPRVGISMEVDPGLYNIQYYGRGPYENYPDRKAGSHMGLWETTPLEMGYDYIVPSENGSRSDCEWIAFGSRDGGEGMLVVAEAGSSFSCSALLHSIDELHHAEHTCDLDARENGKHPIHVNIDHQLMGVGGDVSWFPCVYPEFLVKAQEYNYR
jgi:beta-galactosidase